MACPVMALAPSPHSHKHGIGDFRWRHQAALRIVFGELGHRLLAAATGLLHDVVDAAGDKIGIGKTGHTAFTVTPVLASSSASERTRPTTACFAAL